MTTRPAWIKFYPSDWLNGTVTLTAVERGVYITLLALIYDEAGPIPHTPKILARRCGMTLKAFEEAFDSLLEQGKISLENGAVFNEKAAKILGDVVSRSEKARKGGLARQGKKQQQNQGEASANADPKQEPSLAQPQLDASLGPAILEARSQKLDKKASKLAQKGEAEGQAGDTQDATLEADLRHAAGWHHDAPRLSFVKPIADLIAQGLSLHDDVIPTVRQLAPSVEHKTSWAYFVAALTDLLARKRAQEGKEAHAATKPEGGIPAAPRASTPSVWVWKGTPQWEAWSKGRARPWPTAEQRHPDGGRRPGWYFPSEWPPAAPAASAGDDPPSAAA